MAGCLLNRSFFLLLFNCDIENDLYRVTIVDSFRVIVVGFERGSRFVRLNFVLSTMCKSRIPGQGQEAVIAQNLYLKVILAVNMPVGVV